MSHLAKEALHPLDSVPVRIAVLDEVVVETAELAKLGLPGQ